MYSLPKHRVTSRMHYRVDNFNQLDSDTMGMEFDMIWTEIPEGGPT